MLLTGNCYFKNLVLCVDHYIYNIVVPCRHTVTTVHLPFIDHEYHALPCHCRASAVHSLSHNSPFRIHFRRKLAIMMVGTKASNFNLHSMSLIGHKNVHRIATALHGTHGTHGMHGRATVNSGGPICCTIPGRSIQCGSSFATLEIYGPVVNDPQVKVYLIVTFSADICHVNEPRDIAHARDILPPRMSTHGYCYRCTEKNDKKASFNIEKNTSSATSLQVTRIQVGFLNDTQSKRLDP